MYLTVIERVMARQKTAGQIMGGETHQFIAHKMRVFISYFSCFNDNTSGRNNLKEKGLLWLTVRRCNP